MQSMQSEPETRAQDAAAVRAFTPRAIFVFSLLVGALAAFALFAWYRHGLTMDQSEREQRLANRVAASVQGEIEKLASLALAFQAIYIASDAVSEIEFANAYSLLSANLDSRARVAIAFAQREYIDGSEYYITRLVAPAEGNEALSGLDVGGQPENLRALLRARDGNEVALSAPFPLVQSLPGQPILGVVIRLPVFTPGPLPVDVDERRHRHIGSIGVSFRVSPVIEQVLAQEDRDRYALEIADVTDAREVALVAAAQALPANASHADMRIGGRVWRVRVLATQTAQAWAPWLILGLGLLAALALGSVVVMAQNTRRRAQILARMWSRQHRESEQRLRLLNEMLPALVVLIDAADGRIVYLNRAARERLEVQQGKDVSLVDLIADKEVLKRLIRVVSGGLPLVDEVIQVRGVRGARFWVSMSAARIDLDGRAHLLAVGSDTGEPHEPNERLARQESRDEVTGLHDR